MMTRMHEPQCSVGRYQRGRALRLVLIFFMLFALWHVSQHGARDVISTDNGSDCQVCRLAHAPAAGGAPSLTVAAVFVFAVVLAIAPTPFPRTLNYVPWLARGPPLV